LTDIYREEADLYPGIRQLIERLIREPMLRVGIVTRNITFEPGETLRILLPTQWCGSRQPRLLPTHPAQGRQDPALQGHPRTVPDQSRPGYACGDEKKDFVAALSTGMHPFIASYGFEDYERLTERIGVPPS